VGLTNGVFNIVTLDPFFSALGWEKFMHLSSRDEDWTQLHVVYRGLFGGKVFSLLHPGVEDGRFCIDGWVERGIEGETIVDP